MGKNNEPKIQGRLKRILIVDDDIQIREVLYQLLQKSGYEVKTLPSGATALEMLKKDRPDLIILDHKMPGLDGLVTLKSIREFDKETPVVMLTGHGTGELQISALKLGVNDFLMKGIPTARFLKAVEEVIDRQNILAIKKEQPKAGGKVMVVDDAPEIRKMLEAFLHKNNHEAYLADSGEKALEIIKSKSYQPDVVLLDLELPGMDGFMTLKEIRKLSKHINVIMITGAEESSLRQRALELGALDCLKKPLDLEHLELTIRIRGLGQSGPIVERSD